MGGGFCPTGVMGFKDRGKRKETCHTSDSITQKKLKTQNPPLTTPAGLSLILSIFAFVFCLSLTPPKTRPTDALIFPIAP